MVKIFIENQELDVMQDFTHQITYAIDDIKNLDSKATTFTKTIILPGTAHNNALLGNIFELTNSNFTTDTAPNVGYNFNAAKSAQARIEENGLQIMKGVMRLMEIVVDGSNIEYEVALFGELGGFINALGSKKLTGNDIASDDLDFSEYNHDWNITNIQNSWNRATSVDIASVQFFSDEFEDGIVLYNYYLTNIGVGSTITISNSTNNNCTYTIGRIRYNDNGTTWDTFLGFNENLCGTAISDTDITITIDGLEIGKGYVYPLIDYGGVTRTYYDVGQHDFNYTAFRPAFFVHEIIDKIIFQAGYSYESNFFNTNFFNRLIIPNNDKALLNRTTTDYIVGNEINDYSASDVNAVLPVILTNSTLINFSYNSTTGVYTYNGTNAIQIKLTMLITGQYSISNYSNGGIAVVATQGGVLQSAYQTGSGLINTSLTNIITLNSGDTLKVYVWFNGNPRIGWSSNFSNLNITFSVVQDPPVAIEYLYGQTLNMNYLLPKNIYQKDFFISIMKMFNLYVTEDKFITNHIKIEPYVDFYDTGNYLDWTEKVDRSYPIRIKPMSEINSRYYQFKFKEFSDYWNDKYRSAYFEGYGDRMYDNLFEFTTETQTNEVIFSATPLVLYKDEDKVISAIYKMNNALQESIEHNIRIMQFQVVGGVTNWRILNETTILWESGEGGIYPYAGHLDNPDLPSVDLNFGATKELNFPLAEGALSNNMFNAYYSPYMAEITDKDSRLVTARMKFNELDIFNLDFKRLIFIDNVVYRLSKIIDYSLGELCNVELLRVINTTYFDVAPAFELGQLYGGGIISYIDESGQHGIIRALDDARISDVWSVVPSVIGTSIDYGEGRNNTITIYNANSSLNTAAIYCYTFTGGGFNDWFLPSENEIIAMVTAAQWNDGNGNDYSFMLTSSESLTDPENYAIMQYGATFFGDNLKVASNGFILPCRYF